MDSSDKFWLCFWFILGLTLATIVCVPTYIEHKHDIDMAQAGYVQKVIVTRPGNEWVSPITEKIWVKIGEDGTVEKK
jgi:phosphate starvation-inducible protein PhoH